MSTSNISFLMILLISYTGLVFGQEDAQEAPRTVRVRGSGTASASPDTALIQLGVQVINTDVEIAVEESTERMEKVSEVLEDMDIPDENIQTVRYNIFVEQDRDQRGRPTGVIRYHVNNRIQVKLQDLPKIGELLRRVLSAGANSVDSIRFDIENPDSLEREARSEAIAQAREEARQLAAGFGVHLGSIRQISEQRRGPIVPYAARMQSMEAAADSAIPISEGEISVTVDVEAIFDLAVSASR
ncbi:MAG: SIMPL domain-containing protein [Acidobacteriota bacterium]